MGSGKQFGRRKGGFIMDRREFIGVAGAALTGSLFTGKLKGAKDRVTMGFIGT